MLLLHTHSNLSSNVFAKEVEEGLLAKELKACFHDIWCDAKLKQELKAHLDTS
jgi:hypothetical protein